MSGSQITEDNACNLQLDVRIAMLPTEDFDLSTALSRRQASSHGKCRRPPVGHGFECQVCKRLRNTRVRLVGYAHEDDQCLGTALVD